MSACGCFQSETHRPYIKTQYLLVKTEVKVDMKTSAVLNPFVIHSPCLSTGSSAVLTLLLCDANENPVWTFCPVPASFGHCFVPL